MKNEKQQSHKGELSLTGGSCAWRRQEYISRKVSLKASGLWQGIHSNENVSNVSERKKEKKACRVIFGEGFIQMEMSRMSQKKRKKI